MYFGRQRWHTDPFATLRHMTNSGGGWGEPLSRPVAKVLEDVRDGYISIAGAQRDYGVIIHGDPEQDPEGLTWMKPARARRAPPAQLVLRPCRDRARSQRRRSARRHTASCRESCGP